MGNKVVLDGARTPRWRSADASSLYAPGGGRKYLNSGERRRAMAAMEELKPKQKLFALTLAWTGARPSEVLALVPASFQLEACVAAIRTLKRRRFAVREVPIPPDLMRELADHFGLAGRQADGALSQERLWRWDRVAAWRIIKSVVRASEIVGAQACPRGFRHGFGVGTLQAGVPLNLTQRWLGHSRLATTAIYADACGPEEVGFAAKFWDENQRDPAAAGPCETA